MCVHGLKNQEVGLWNGFVSVCQGLSIHNLYYALELAMKYLAQTLFKAYAKNWLQLGLQMMTLSCMLKFMHSIIIIH